jgi:hypothetical protein
MVQALTGGSADIHAGALAHRFQAFQYLYVFRAVVLILVHHLFSLVSFLYNVSVVIGENIDLSQAVSTKVRGRAPP